MGWKAKRLVGTAIWATMPYLAWSFVALDWWSAFGSVDNRLFWLVLTAGVALIAYTYPFWRDDA